MSVSHSPGINREVRTERQLIKSWQDPLARVQKAWGVRSCRGSLGIHNIEASEEPLIFNVGQTDFIHSASTQSQMETQI